MSVRLAEWTPDKHFYVAPGARAKDQPCAKCGHQFADRSVHIFPNGGARL